MPVIDPDDGNLVSILGYLDVVHLLDQGTFAVICLLNSFWFHSSLFVCLSMTCFSLILEINFLFNLKKISQVGYSFYTLFFPSLEPTSAYLSLCFSFSPGWLLPRRVTAAKQHPHLFSETIEQMCIGQFVDVLTAPRSAMLCDVLSGRLTSQPSLLFSFLF